MKKALAATVAIALLGAGAVIAAPAASADTCRPSSWNSTDIWGNPKYNCSDGTYTLKKPGYSNNWNDPWTTYELNKDYGYGTDSRKCRYSSWNNSYKCTSSYGW